jgi:hypothetical protein
VQKSENGFAVFQKLYLFRRRETFFPELGGVAHSPRLENTLSVVKQNSTKIWFRAVEKLRARFEKSHSSVAFGEKKIVERVQTGKIRGFLLFSVARGRKRGEQAF